MKNENSRKGIFVMSVSYFLILTCSLSAKAQEPVTVASFTTTYPTNGLCTPAPVEFQIGYWYNNSPGTTYVVDFGDGNPNITLQHPLNSTNTVYLLTHTYNKSSCPANGFTATLKVTNGSYAPAYTVQQIIVRQAPVVNFGVPATCVNTPVCFTNQTQNGHIDNSCTAGNFTWDFGDGNSSTQPNPPCHTYSTPGNYTVTLRNSNACGSDFISKLITVNLVSASPDVITPIIYCQGETSVPLNATGTGLRWYTTASGGAGSVTAPRPSTAIAGERTYYVSQTLPGHCESQRVSVTVNVNPAPVTPVVVSPVTLCLDQAATPLEASGSNLFWYTSAAGTTGSVTAPIPSTAAAGTTVYYVSETTLCGESSRAPVVVNVNERPAQPFITATVPLCVGDALTLKAFSPVPENAALDYLWEGPAKDFPVHAADAVINNIQTADAGRYKITVRSPQTGCSVTADTLIEIGNYPVVKFTQDVIASPYGYPLNLVPVIANANAPGVSPVEQYTWTPDQELSYPDATHSSASVTVKDNSCYTVTATNIHGCSGSGTVCVQALCKNSQVFIPNAFTPGGNVPENRKLIVRAAGVNMVRSFRIFNRWGAIVFERHNFPPNDPAYGWDGQSYGKPAESGVYVYTVDVVCENSVPYSFKGNVTLL